MATQFHQIAHAEFRDDDGAPVELNVHAEILDYENCKMACNCRVSARRADGSFEGLEFQVLLEGTEGRIRTDPTPQEVRRRLPAWRTIRCATRCGVIVLVGDLLGCLWENGPDPEGILTCPTERGASFGEDIRLCFAGCMAGAGMRGAAGAPAPA